METTPPIYTERNECQDCFKCVRECPVKAIKIGNSCANVIPEACIACGHCVGVCPSGAKRVRDDLAVARTLLATHARVLVSLAPSFVSEFVGVAPAALIGALKQLGFYGVSETALGAQAVSGSVAVLLGAAAPRLLISSACPVIVDYLQKYQPAYASALTPFASPVLAHAYMLRARYGQDIGVVFVSPCIAKKREADAHADVLNVAITFADLHAWLAEQKIVPAALTPRPEDVFVPEAAEEGGLYPIDGGMSASVKAGCSATEAQCMAFSGIATVQKALDGLQDMPLERPLFLELLACEGGCVNGPKAVRMGGTAGKRARIIRYARLDPARLPRAASAPALVFPSVEPIVARNYAESQLQECLRSIGKLTREDELNCGGCGYDNCREFAKALADGKAEKAMCVTYMRKLAQKKANALMARTPNGVVIADADLKIIECNANFARMLGPEQEAAFQAKPGLEGTALRIVAPFHHLFQAVLDKGGDILNRDIRYRQSVLHASVFSIEEHHVVCGIFQDITRPAVKKERVINQAQEVIRKNLATVQQIAFLLGENAAESEITLNAMIESFSNVEEAGESEERPAAGEADGNKR
jgi:iron only hydrogenase large subunit-like protein